MRVTQIYWRASARGTNADQGGLAQSAPEQYRRAGWGRGREGRGRPAGQAAQERTRPHLSPVSPRGNRGLSRYNVPVQGHTPIPCRYPGPQLTSENLTPSSTLPRGSPHPRLSLPFQISTAGEQPARPALRKLLPQPEEEADGSRELFLQGPPPDGPAVRTWMPARPRQGQEASSAMLIRPGL